MQTVVRFGRRPWHRAGLVFRVWSSRGNPVNRAWRFRHEIGAQPSGSAEGVPLTWSAPARLQACSSTWSSAAAAIVAGRAGHLVDQVLAADLVRDATHQNAQHYAPGCATYARPRAWRTHKQDTNTPTHTNMAHLVDQLLQLVRSRTRWLPSRYRPPAPGLARSTRCCRIRPDHVPGMPGLSPHPVHHPAKAPRTAQDASGAAIRCRVAARPPARLEPAVGPLMPLGRGEAGGRGGTSPVPPDFGGPLLASGLCRGLCCDAEGRPGSRPAAAGLRRDPGRMVLMRIDARTGAFSTPGEGPGRREGLKPAHRQNFVDSWIGPFPHVTL